jgi:hypothetical protein
VYKDSRLKRMSDEQLEQLLTKYRKFLRTRKANRRSARKICLVFLSIIHEQAMRDIQTGKYKLSQSVQKAIEF